MMTCVQVAFKADKNETEFKPCHVNQLLPGDVFYIVTNGHKGELRIATGNPFETRIDNEPAWDIDSNPHHLTAAGDATP